MSGISGMSSAGLKWEQRGCLAINCDPRAQMSHTLGAIGSQSVRHLTGWVQTSRNAVPMTINRPALLLSPDARATRVLYATFDTRQFAPVFPSQLIDLPD